MAVDIIGIAFFMAAIWTWRFGVADNIEFASSNGTKENFQSFLSLDGRTSRLQFVSRNSPEFSMAQWRALVERLLELRCSSEKMTVLLHYSYGRTAPKAVEDVLSSGSLYTDGITVTACNSIHGSMKKGEEALVLVVPYGHCGVRRREGGDRTVVYSETVVFEANGISDGSSYGSAQRPISIRESYTIQCIHPLIQPSFSFALSGDKHSSSGHWTFPHVVDASNYIYLSSNVSLAWQAQQEVFSYPIDCWASPASNVAKAPKKYFVRNGCTVHKNSILHHFTNGPTKVSVQGSALFFDGANDELPSNPNAPAGKSQDIILSCDVIPCTHSSIMGLLNIPKCPPSYFCSGKPGTGDNILPARLQGVKRTNVVAGPVTLKEVPKMEQSATTVNCHLKCAQQLSTVNDLPQGPVKPTIYEYTEGVSLRTSIVIAFASFVFGVLVVAGLWWVHVRTDPKRLKVLQEYYAQQSRTVDRPTTFSLDASSPRYQKRRLRDSGCHSVTSSSQLIREPIPLSQLSCTSAKPASDSKETSEDATTARLL